MWIEMINCVFCRQKKKPFGGISQSRTSTSSATTSSIFTPAFPLNHHNPHHPHHHASTSSETQAPPPPHPQPPASAPPRISLGHKMVKSKSKFRQCDVCERFFIFDFVRRQQQLDDVHACSVCGIRVHRLCLDKLKDDCKMTKQIMGGILENAVIQSNKKQWEPDESVPVVMMMPTVDPPPVPVSKLMITSPTDSSLADYCSSSSPPPPLVEYYDDKNVNSTTRMCTMSSTNNNPMMTMTASTMDDVTTLYSEAMDLDDERELMQWNDITIRLSDVHVKGRIGEGRFGTVHFSEYHGDAAVKFVNMDYLKDDIDRKVEVFTQEIVTAYKNSRHEHIALFYGYVVDLATSTFAIVTNFYQHKTLYHRIHEQPDDYEQPWICQISLQICQAMSYLHKKKILHRDLRSKNILLDNPNRVVVADFALMNLERLAHPKRDYTLIIPNHWIDYLAPEVARNLVLNWRGDVMFEHELPLTPESDVYSIGTIFFELLLRKMPTGYDSWEQKLFAKFNGHKAPIQRHDTQLQKTDPKLHELLINCWSCTPEKRPTFAHIVKKITAMMPRNKESNKQKRRSTAHENPLF